MKKSIIHEATAIARKRLQNHPEFKSFIHFSFVIQNNQIVEVGRNNKRAPPLHFGYQRRLINADYGPKTHSEIDAYRKARGLLRPNKHFEILNIRLNKQSLFRNSKPCWCCYQLLKLLGCKTFYFTVNGEEFLKA